MEESKEDIWTYSQNQPTFEHAVDWCNSHLQQDDRLITMQWVSTVTESFVVIIYQAPEWRGGRR